SRGAAESSEYALASMVVMLTSVGQRVDIARAFRAAGATTLGIDADPLAPALYHCDRRVIVPRIAEPAYVPTLAALREEHDVCLVIPLNDLDFPVLARERRRLAPALVLLPDPEVSARMSDKLEAHRFFVSSGIPSPRSWAPEEVPEDVRYPVLVKAREGFGSRNIFRAADRAQLDFFLAYTDVPSFVQEACLGEEFSIDVFCDLEGRCLNAIPRTMLLSKGGESIKGASIRDRELIEHGARVAETVGIKGPANVQCFREPDGSLPITDVNTRFGGGFPVPLAAGGRYPELALALARGERPEPQLGDFREGVVMTRFFSEVCLEPGEDGVLRPLT
ncbi:MAG TPA: ATP-grasp domain-containing protein, partial [Gaiellaceae bacterium]|nr:ATP-grasp domain-containing protein [Gaiellaceae bacterium]